LSFKEVWREQISFGSEQKVRSKGEEQRLGGKVRSKGEEQRWEGKVRSKGGEER